MPRIRTGCDSGAGSGSAAGFVVLLKAILVFAAAVLVSNVALGAVSPPSCLFIEESTKYKTTHHTELIGVGSKPIVIRNRPWRDGNLAPYRRLSFAVWINNRGSDFASLITTHRLFKAGLWRIGEPVASEIDIKPLRWRISHIPEGRSLPRPKVRADLFQENPRAQVALNGVDRQAILPVRFVGVPPHTTKSESQHNENAYIYVIGLLVSYLAAFVGGWHLRFPPLRKSTTGCGYSWKLTVPYHVYRRRCVVGTLLLLSGCLGVIWSIGRLVNS